MKEYEMKINVGHTKVMRINDEEHMGVEISKRRTEQIDEALKRTKKDRPLLRIDQFLIKRMRNWILHIMRKN